MILRDPPKWAVDTVMWLLCPIWAPAAGIILLTVLLDSWWQADFGPKRGVWERHFAWWPVDAEPVPGEWTVRIWWEWVYRTKDRWTGGTRYCRVLPAVPEDDGFVTIHPRTGRAS